MTFISEVGRPSYLVGTVLLLLRMAASLYPRGCQTGKHYIYGFSLSLSILRFLPPIPRHSSSYAASKAITSDFSHCVSMFRQNYGICGSWSRF